MKELIIRTPLLPFYDDTETYSQIFLKPENLQLFGSYKIRGVASVIEDANKVELQHGLFSSECWKFGTSSCICR